MSTWFGENKGIVDFTTGEVKPLPEQGLYIPQRELQKKEATKFRRRTSGAYGAFYFVLTQLFEILR